VGEKHREDADLFLGNGNFVGIVIRETKEEGEQERELSLPKCTVENIQERGKGSGGGAMAPKNMRGKKGNGKTLRTHRSNETYGRRKSVGPKKAEKKHELGIGTRKTGENHKTAEKEKKGGGKRKLERKMQETQKAKGNRFINLKDGSWCAQSPGKGSRDRVRREEVSEVKGGGRG